MNVLEIDRGFGTFVKYEHLNNFKFLKFNIKCSNIRDF